MFAPLVLVIVLPLAGFLTLTLVPLRARTVAVIGVGSVGLSALAAIVIAARFLSAPPSGHAYLLTLWTWIKVGDFAPALRLRVDPLSLVMMLVITVIGFLIHLYSAGFMANDDGYRRYFAYMNLFIVAMLVLVLADNLLFLYLGWEGVGLCSYLLIGFWYRDIANGRAARKAFIVTRVGDTAFAIGLLLLFTQLHTLEISTALYRATQQWPIGSPIAVGVAALLLGGAVGKSAQLPLQTWLPDAMAGPTPVSALIHAATMVTAGVYLIARLHTLYVLAPDVQLAVAIIGALTLLLAGVSALVQSDIKRVLAYSTISQIGYMFLALGVGAWSAAIFHLMTHAFFKALLFLSAGSVIYSLHHEQDMFRMGGLRTRLPLTFWSFLIGSASLAALPLVTAGFYSKDLILSAAWSSPRGGHWLWLAGWIGALITAIYIFRAVFITFFGEASTEVGPRAGFTMRLPLVILSVLSLFGGFVQTPALLGHISWFVDVLRPIFSQTTPSPPSLHTEALLAGLAAGASLLGLYIAYRLFIGIPVLAPWIASTVIGGALRRFLLSGWGFDALYDRLWVQPFLRLARLARRDPLDGAYRGLAALSAAGFRGLSRLQTGQLRWYAGVLAAGVLLIVAMVVLP